MRSRRVAGGAHTDLKATRPQGQTSPWQSQKSKPRAPQNQEPDKTFRAESFQGENFIGRGGRGAPLVQTWCATPVPQTLFCLTTAILKSKRPPRACPKADPREIRGTFCEPKNADITQELSLGYRGRTKVWTRGAPRPPRPKTGHSSFGVRGAHRPRAGPAPPGSERGQPRSTSVCAPLTQN